MSPSLSLSHLFTVLVFGYLILSNGYLSLCAGQDIQAKSISGASRETSHEDFQRQMQSQHFHSMAQERPGILIPLYHYPANIHTNDVFNRVMQFKRKFPTVPTWVILNPATGPGTVVDPNYTKAIDRLIGSGCIVLAYVSTEYGKREANLVDADLSTWQKFYPRIQGVFFDEMIYEDTAEAAAHQNLLSRTARSKGYWPLVTNPGADTPERFFRDNIADVIIVHESADWPAEERIHGDYFGGYADYPPHARGVLVHSMKKYDVSKVEMITRYAKWLYVTQDQYRLNDPSAPNPWDSLSEHLDLLGKQLSQK